MRRVFPFVIRLLAKALIVGPEKITRKDVDELFLSVELKDLPSVMSKFTDQAYSLIVRDRDLASNALGLLPGQCALLSNGKVRSTMHAATRVCKD